MAKTPKYIEDFGAILKQLKGEERKVFTQKFRVLVSEAKTTLKTQNKTKARSISRKSQKKNTTARRVSERKGRPSLLPQLSLKLHDLAIRVFENPDYNDRLRQSAQPLFEEGKTPFLDSAQWKRVREQFTQRFIDTQTATGFRRGIKTLENLMNDEWLFKHTTNQILTAIYGREKVQAYKEELRDYGVNINALSVGFQMAGIERGLEQDWNSANPIVTYFLNMKEEGNQLIDEGMALSRQWYSPTEDQTERETQAKNLIRRGKSRVTRAENKLRKEWSSYSKKSRKG